MAETGETKDKKQVKVKIKIDDGIAQGIYCNFATVNHSETEFIVDFIFVQPQAPKADVRSRIILSPKHFKRLVMAMEGNLKKHEERFGKVDVSMPAQIDPRILQ